MPRPAPSVDKRYKNRPTSQVVVNLQIDREAAHLLRQHAEGPRALRQSVDSRLSTTRRISRFSRSRGADRASEALSAGARRYSTRHSRLARMRLARHAHGPGAHNIVTDA
jgi:hypothetical protein